MASPQSSQQNKPYQLSRTVSKALRTLGASKDIQCTKSLIQAYSDNGGQDANGIALHQWLEAYVVEFSRFKAESMPEKLVGEYTLLALINVKSLSAIDLVRRVYVSLRSCIKSGEYCSPVIIVALDNVLRVMDTKVIEKETQSLVSLADDLLCLTNPEKGIFTRETCAFHMACLLTLERILIVLHGVECIHSKQHVTDFFQKKLRVQLKAIAAKQKYYPFVYSAQLIKYNVDSLIKGGPTATPLNAGRQAFYAFCGGLYLFQGIRELAVMRLDFAAIEAGAQTMHQAFSGLLDSSAPGLLEVVHAASKSATTGDFRHIMDCYKKHEHPSFIDGVASEKLKIVKFALISHLTLFAYESSVGDLSDQAFDLLSKLAVNDDTSQWRANPDIYERLLDALASVGAKRQCFRQRCLQSLHQMETSSIQNQQTVKDWRGVYSIEQKLDMKHGYEPGIPSSSLYETIRKHLGLHLTYASSLAHKKELIEHYQDESFAKVSLFLDDVKKRHIADFNFHIVVYELVDANNQAINNERSAGDDQMAHNLERSRWVRTPIELQDVFARRRQKPFGLEEEVSHVLVIGNPGTGKTSLSKRLCHDWTFGNWGVEFDRVYRLPVRQLTGSRLQLEKTLEGAIAVLLFSAEHKPEEERNALRRRIKDELDERTTLLMLDGLDEAISNDTAEEIIRDAMSRSCSVIVLSRPHNLRDLRARMDTEMECLGLSDEQLRAYVSREVPSASNELIHFLRKSPPVWEIAQVPVNVQILCTLWISEGGQSLKELRYVNLTSLYSTMALYAWKRFIEKTEERIDCQAVFSSLETIAFESIRQSKIEIPLDLVMKNAQGATTDRLFCKSGFLLFHKEGQVFQFAHLSSHEFFAGRFLAKHLRGTEKENKKARKYIAEHKYSDTSRVTLSFMVQFYCQEEDDDEEDCIECLKDLLSILDENPVEVFGLQHILLKLRTLDAILSVCGNRAEDIRSNENLQTLIQFVVTVLHEWMEKTSASPDLYALLGERRSVYDQIVEELIQMPNVFRYLPDLLQTVLRPRDGRGAGEGKIREIATLVSCALELPLQAVPMELRADVNDDDYAIKLATWFQICCDFGPECVVLALEHLKTACRSQSEEIRKIGYTWTVMFLRVLPDREELYSLCLDATEDASVEVRTKFIERLTSARLKPNTVAADLAWTLALKAIRDNDAKIRYWTFRFLIRSDKTSAANIEEMIALLLEWTCEYVGDTYWLERLLIHENIAALLRRCPTKLALFLPYLASSWNDPRACIVEISVTQAIADLILFLSTPQKKRAWRNDIKNLPRC